MDPGWIGRGGANGSGRRLQGAAIHRRGDPVGRSLVSDVSHQLPRSRTDAPRPRRRGRPHNDLPLYLAYAEELEKRIRTHLRMSNGSWRVDETYVRVKGRWMYLDRAVDSRGQTIDFLLAARRDTAAANRFFRKALAPPHPPNPRTLTVDKNPAYPRAVADMKSDGQLWRRTRLRQCKYLNNIVEQDHRRIKRLVRPGLVFGSFRTAPQTLAGFETMAMMRKGQVRKIDGHDIPGQAAFIA